MGQWNTIQWNSGEFNEASGYPLAQFVTVQPGDTLNVFGFFHTDPLYYGFTVNADVVGALTSATFKVRTTIDSSTDIISLAIGLGSGSDGGITAVGDDDYQLYFLLNDSVLTPVTTYVYILTALDINGYTGTWTGFLRTII